MISHLDDEFIRVFSKLPERVRLKARKNYKLWKENPAHPSLEFKKVHANNPIYSVRIGMGWRALGVKQHKVMIWFWIGSHKGYDKLLSQL